MNNQCVIFSAPGIAGQALAKALLKIGVKHGFDSRIESEPTPIRYFEICLTAAIVIVDASIEDGRDHIYRAVSVLPSLFEHVLIVGRTYLPLNFVSLPYTFS